jgi:UPF0176 protein
MFTVAAFYRFFGVSEPVVLQHELREAFTAEELCGSLLIAGEGINGTLAGSAEVMDRLLQECADQRPRCAGARYTQPL